MFYYQLHDWMQITINDPCLNTRVVVYSDFNMETFVCWLASDLEPSQLKRYDG